MVAIVGSLEWRLSGGAGNSNPLLSLGGVMSSVKAVGTNLFPDVDQTTAFLGTDRYLCLYLLNTNTDQTAIALGLTAWILSDFPEAEHALNMQYDSGITLPGGAGDGITTGVAEVIADINTAPAAVVFPTPVPLGPSVEDGGVPGTDVLNLVNLQPGQALPFWFWEHVNPTTKESVASLANVALSWGK